MGRTLLSDAFDFGLGFGLGVGLNLKVKVKAKAKASDRSVRPTLDGVLRLIPVTITGDYLGTLTICAKLLRLRIREV